MKLRTQLEEAFDNLYLDEGEGSGGGGSGSGGAGASGT
jgi:hypothetical protein